MIEKLMIEGFKCFDEIYLNFKDITLLAGQNSMGKSSIIQALLALKQAGKKPFVGPYMSIGNVEELMNAYTGAEEISLKAEYVDAKGNAKNAYVTMKGLNAASIKSNALKSNIVYCSAERLGVQDVYQRAVDQKVGVGINCEFAFSYFAENSTKSLKALFVYDETTKLTLAGQVNYWLEKIAGYKVFAEFIEKTDLVRVFYRNENMRSSIRPKNVGTGITYIAEIIIAAFSCKPGDLLMIENPEIHLHPSAQAKFVEFVAFISTCGVQVVMETHSDHIYNGLRKCIHEDFLSPENVRIYFFKQIENGCSYPVDISVDENGKALVTQEGFFDQIKKDLDVILGW